MDPQRIFWRVWLSIHWKPLKSNMPRKWREGPICRLLDCDMTSHCRQTSLMIYGRVILKMHLRSNQRNMQVALSLTLMSLFTIQKTRASRKKWKTRYRSGKKKTHSLQAKTHCLEVSPWARMFLTRSSRWSRRRTKDENRTFYHMQRSKFHWKGNSRGNNQ